MAARGPGPQWDPPDPMLILLIGWTIALALIAWCGAADSEPDTWVPIEAADGR